MNLRHIKQENIFVVAEAGANHNRNFEQALKLIEAAKVAGADAVKFQTYSADTLYVSNTPDFAGYSNINKLIGEIEIPRSWQRDLKKYCDEIGIEFMSTPFDEAAVRELVDLGVKRLKIAGFEATDVRFVSMVAETKFPLVISIGIGADFTDIESILSICSKAGNSDVTLLHCNNAYPTPPQDINLLTICEIKKRFDVKVGFSDHTENTITPALAVMVGAEMIEKHFTLDRRLPGPDHSFALEPCELQDMIRFVRYAEMTKGVRLGRFTDSEENFRNAARSVVSLHDLEPGDILTRDNITTKRPCLASSIPASAFFDVLGRRVIRWIPRDSIVSIGDLSL